MPAAISKSSMAMRTSPPTPLPMAMMRTLFPPPPLCCSEEEEEEEVVEDEEYDVLVVLGVG